EKPDHRRLVEATLPRGEIMDFSGKNVWVTGAGKYVAGRSGRVVMTEELLPAPIPASKAALREVILPLLDESDEPFDDDNLIDYGLDSVRMMALAARWRKVHGDIDFVMLAKNPTIDAWWKLLSREVK
ncbi:hypothetical protein BMR86_25260, partial [Stenotrophomonas sp. KAs 5-3]